MGEVMSDIAERYDKLTKTKKMSREETVTKYSVQLCIVKVEVQPSGIIYDDGEVEDVELLDTFDDYDEALDLYNEHIKN